MTHTVTSLFHSERHAADAADRLERAGIPRDRIDIWSTPHNLATLLQDKGVSRSDAHAYAEGVIRGGCVVIVTCAAAEVGQAVGILDQEGVLDLDEQRTAWRAEGWRDEAAAAAEAAEAEAAPAPADRPGSTRHGRVRIQPGRTQRPAQP